MPTDVGKADNARGTRKLRTQMGGLGLRAVAGEAGLQGGPRERRRRRRGEDGAAIKGCRGQEVGGWGFLKCGDSLT